jgi:hypothetical protein
VKQGLSGQSRLGVAILIFLCVTFLVLALTAPFGRGVWSQIPPDFRLPLLGFFANLVLLGVTWAYVLITREQLRELQTAREPRAVLKLRVPEAFDVERYIKYGRGDRRYRSGPPLYLDVWNVSGPTIMVMEVTVSVNDTPDKEGLRIAPLAPQLLVESGKVVSINVAYQLMFRVAPGSGEFIDFPDMTRAAARFTVKYFSLSGERSVEIRSKFHFRVSEEHIVTWVEA